MAIGTVVIDGRTCEITRIRLQGGMVKITAVHRGPMRPCSGMPAAVFGEDGQGICQSWETTIPGEAAICDFVTIELPIRIDSLETT